MFEERVKRILIVDDDPRIRRMIMDRLNAGGSEFLEGSNGHEALALYREHQPDWVIMDIQMPEVDGLTATRSIRNDDPAARILILTSFDHLRWRQAAQEAGAVGYLLKDELSLLHEVLKSSTSDSPASDGRGNYIEAAASAPPSVQESKPGVSGEGGSATPHTQEESEFSTES